MQEKRCTKCGEIKPLDAYTPHAQTADRLRPDCKACHAIYNKRYREKNAAAIKQYKHEAYLVTALERNEGKRKPCLRCGGPKPPGERRRHCDSCIPLAEEDEREQARLRARRYYEENTERCLATCRAWAKANPEKVRESARRQRERWPERNALHSKRWRALMYAAFVEDVHPLVVLERDDGVCGICGGDVDPLQFDVDHIMPLSKGGEHSYANTQPAHPACNRSKGAKVP